MYYKKRLNETTFVQKKSQLLEILIRPKKLYCY